MSMNVTEEVTSGFAALGLDPRLTDALGYDDPSPIQRESIPHLLEGKDLVGLAGTGTGKTAAFALPMIHKLSLDTTRRKGVSALILVPTRELAMQVAKSVLTYGKPINVTVLAVYGGTAYGEQIQTIRRGVDVIVATPGRALDLIRKGKMPLEHINTVVLDEADEMLDMGFAEDIEAILSETPNTRQTMLFSATMPPRIEAIAARHLKSPTRIRVAREEVPASEAPKVRQTAYLVQRHHKLAALARILDGEQPTSAIIFCRTRTEADELTDMLGQRGYRPMALHGGLSQEHRDQVMKKFRAGTADLLIATDIAARGLDITQLSHVINFDVPTQADAYVHRIGRVGRAGREGVAITLATTREQSALNNIERVTRQKIEYAKVPTAADLRIKRVARTEMILREAIGKAEASDEMRGMIGLLESAFDLKQIALAAAFLLTQRGEPNEDQNDIPSVLPGTRGRTSAGGESRVREDRIPFSRGTERSGPVDRDRLRGSERDGDEGRRFPAGGDRDRKAIGARPTAEGMRKVFFGAGFDAGISAKDLVGAIANEAGVPGKDLGAIDITDRFSLVEVPEEVAEYVIESMQGSRIRGRKVNVRADRPPRR